MFQGFRSDVRFEHEGKKIVISSGPDEILTSIDASSVVLSISMLPDQTIKYGPPHFGIDLYSVALAETFEMVFYSTEDASTFIAALQAMTGDESLNAFNTVIIQAQTAESNMVEKVERAIDESISSGFDFNADEGNNEVLPSSLLATDPPSSPPPSPPALPYASASDHSSTAAVEEPKKRQSFFSRMFGSSSSSSSSAAPLARSSSFSSEVGGGGSSFSSSSNTKRAVIDDSIDADIEAYEEEMDDTASVSSFSVSGSPRSERGPISQLTADPTLKLSLTHQALLTLTDIGKNIKAIETQAKSMDDERRRDWETYHKPIYRSQVSELAQVVKDTQEKIDRELFKGPEHVAEMEDRLKAYVDVLEDTKKKLYFPLSNIVIGG
jgi:hypothetical protein